MKKMMKAAKMRNGFLALAMMMVVCAVLALSGCAGQSQSEGDDSASSAAAAGSSQDALSSADVQPGDLGRVLVAYYSASGNTEEVAEEIASALDADLFAIEPVEPYTEADLSWQMEGSRVNIEHDDASQRDIALVQVTPDGFTGYDTVFIGYPIWWGIAAWPVDGFVSGNDFTGKTVIPFCTSASSGLGASATELEALAGTGNWMPGQRFSSNPSASEVREWALSL